MLAVTALCLSLLGCGGGSSSSGDDNAVEVAPQPERVVIAGAGELGIFDPALARDPLTQRLWMSYSSVDSSAVYPPSRYWVVSIRLAYSDDGGVSWQDAGVVLAPASETPVGPLPVGAASPPIAAASHGIWQSETSSLVYDPGAPADQRWKLLWFQYLNANGHSYYADYSWIGLKMAATPLQLASATPIKLFAGAGLQADNSNTGAPLFAPIGTAPAIRLNLDLTRSLGGADRSELSLCVFAEPGLHATADALYLAIFCADASTAPITEYLVYFRCASPCTITAANGWEYAGRLLSPADAAAAGVGHHYQAPALVQQDGRYYLLVTPVDSTATQRYDGCRVYQLEGADSNRLLRSGAQPLELARVEGNAGSHHGACAGYPGADGGLLLSQYSADTPPQTFRIFKSQVRIP